MLTAPPCKDKAKATWNHLEFFYARDRKPNLSLLKKKRNLLDAVTEKCTGSSSFKLGFIQGVHIISPGPGFPLFHPTLPVPLVWLHPKTHPPLTETRWLQQQHICPGSQKSFSLVDSAQVLGVALISSRIFTISFLQPPLSLLCYSFSSFLRYELQSLILDLSAFA